jgi:acetyltransferase
MFEHHSLRHALTPRSVAVVGATDKPAALGRFVLANLLAGGFKGDIHPVNPKYAEVAGRACFESVRALPAPVDLAIVATPARTVPAIIDEAGDRGIQFVLVLSAGFAEAGPEGLRLQQQALARARAKGVRLLGPNSVGLLRPALGLNASVSASFARPGSVALVSQSGAVMTALLDHAWSSGFGFSSVVSTGSGVDVEFADILDFLTLDVATRSIVLYVEGLHDARAFMSSVRAAASVKPVVILKVGRHMTGLKTAMSHTGALVGNDAVFETALKRAGAIRVRAYNQMFAAAEALAAGRLPQGAYANRLAILTNGAGPGVLAADAVAGSGVALAGLSPPATESLDAALPAGWPRTNPVDILGDADAERFARSLQILLDDESNDGVLVLVSPMVRLDTEATAKALLEVVTPSSKPVVSVWLGDHEAARGRAVFKAAGHPALMSPERGVETFSYLSLYVQNRRLRLQVPPPRVDEFDLDLGGARHVLREALEAGRAALDERESKRLLDCFGITTVPTSLATTPEEAVLHATRIGFPVVLKVVASGITHKSEVVGVLLGLRSAEEVARGYAQIQDNVATRAPTARFVGVHVQAMVERPGGRELIIGIARDPNFGPVITFGMGGIGVEVFRDSALALPPLNRFLAQEMIAATRVSEMLGEFRGRPPVKMDDLVDVLLKVSEIACELPCVEELDINPVLADDAGVIALDARVVLGDGTLVADASYSHLAIHPYPKNLWRAVRLRTGDTTLLRPIRPEDAEAEQRFISRLSPRSIYLRFHAPLRVRDQRAIAQHHPRIERDHAPLRELSEDRLIRFTQIDYDREMAFVATDMQGDVEEIHGVARYIRNPDRTSCEFGLVVEDAWHGRGLGGALMAALEGCARERGLREIIGFVIADNDDMGRLMTGRGYAPHRDPDDPSVLRFIKAL